MYVLSAHAFMKLSTRCRFMNDSLNKETATGYDVWRRDDMDNYINNLAYKLQREANTCTVAS